MEPPSVGSKTAMREGFDLPRSPYIEIANHLQRQVCIVCELSDFYRNDISRPEQDWIQNAINYANHVLSKVSAQPTPEDHENKLHRVLPSFQALSARSGQHPPQAALWNSQMMIAMQNLNGVMNMLSSCIRANTQTNLPLTASSAVHLPLDGQKVELSQFLNRRRVRRSSSPVQMVGQYVETVGDTITGTGVGNSLLHSTTRDIPSTSGTNIVCDDRLSLTLAETVEVWRQNAEDALKAAMAFQFEQDVLNQPDAHEHIGVNTLVVSQPAAFDVRSETSASTESPARSRKYSSSTFDNSVSDSSSQLGRLSNTSSNLRSRKPLPIQTLHSSHASYYNSPPSSSTKSSQHMSQNFTTYPSYSTSIFPYQTTPPLNTGPSLVTSFDQSLTLTPSISLSPSSNAPELSPFQTIHNEASKSASSILSAPHADRSRSSHDLRIGSVTSLPPGSPSSRQINLFDDSSRRQSDSSSARAHRKSAGRAWLERAMMSEE